MKAGELVVAEPEIRGTPQTRQIIRRKTKIWKINLKKNSMKSYDGTKRLWKIWRNLKLRRDEFEHHPLWILVNISYKKGA